MFSLKSDDHLFQLAKELYEDDNFSDIIFVTDSASFYGHSSLIFQQIPSLSALVCKGCKYSHEKVVIFLPGVSSEFMEIALLEFYLTGDASKLTKCSECDQCGNTN